MLGTLTLVQDLLDGVEVLVRVPFHTSQVLRVESLLERPSSAVLCPLLQSVERWLTWLLLLLLVHVLDLEDLLTRNVESAEEGVLISRIRVN
jgi:hypothetical protein